MKILLTTSAWPPEHDGPSGAFTRRLTLALANAGDEVIVLAGAVARADELALRESRDEGLRVIHLARNDHFAAHWQKSQHPGVTRLFRKLLKDERPEVVHVQHWRRLSRDLVHAAAREGVPAVITLHDALTSCLLGTRELPGGRGPCTVIAAANPCLGCARSVPPHTPWIPPDAQYIAQHVYHQDFARELTLARAVLVHDERARQFLQGKLAIAPELLAVDSMSEEALLAAHRRLYADALAAGAPAIDAREHPYASLLAEASMREWDAKAAAATRDELGCELEG